MAEMGGFACENCIDGPRLEGLVAGMRRLGNQLTSQAELFVGSYEGMRDAARATRNDAELAQRMEFIDKAESHTAATTAAVGAAVFALEMTETQAAHIVCSPEPRTCPRLLFLLQATDQIAATARDDAAQMGPERPTL